MLWLCVFEWTMAPRPATFEIRFRILNWHLQWGNRYQPISPLLCYRRLYSLLSSTKSSNPNPRPRPSHGSSDCWRWRLRPEIGPRDCSGASRTWACASWPTSCLASRSGRRRRSSASRAWCTACSTSYPVSTATSRPSNAAPSGQCAKVTSTLTAYLTPHTPLVH